jgi:hypothetical protein
MKESFIEPNTNTKSHQKLVQTTHRAKEIKSVPLSPYNVHTTNSTHTRANTIPKTSLARQQQETAPTKRVYCILQKICRTV